MKDVKQQNTPNVSGAFLLIVGALITLCLLLLKQYNVIYLNFELVFAPFILIALLTYGDKLLMHLVISPTVYVANYFSKEEGPQA